MARALRILIASTAILFFLGFLAIAVFTFIVSLMPPSYVVASGPPEPVVLSREGPELKLLLWCIAAFFFAVSAGAAALFRRLSPKK
ncbi:MAG: hypothetical protein IPK73_07410 [Candidatus Obscuribacter sp.]|nr:hypothetical protein [Candidatus Obscuribacter sp.]MBK9279426.1 hypothetical protein [Candidatus Obscuribacter sp.]